MFFRLHRYKKVTLIGLTACVLATLYITREKTFKNFTDPHSWRLGFDLPGILTEKFANTKRPSEERFLYFIGSNKSISSPFIYSLYDAHVLPLNTTNKLTAKQLEEVQREYKFALFVRDPYKRLFSGYVDKIFSRYDYWDFLSKRIINKVRPSAPDKSKKCGTDTRFTDVVRFLVSEISEGKSVDSHFMPIHFLSNPCSAKYDFIGKLENFKTDAATLFSELHVKYQSTLDEIETGSVKDELKDVADIVFSVKNNKRFNENPCFDIHNITRRLWRKLQIKGLISYKFNLTITKKELLSLNETQFLSILTKYNKKSSSEPDCHKARKFSYLEAYYSVPQKDLEDLAKLFSTECELWDYPFKPDIIFDSDKRISTGPITYFNFDDV
ncbi:carbohydrate sulfotransferase 8-like isoform X2 [Octopus vulgaris]|uniref:Carbohydrate sulfotransferase n=1 Tax=Octopus vulgaris TaxID=6645 RepID=A0AA36B017_OCTVU|nr:carbohydrate sulfotransferase 8-like isoform X2 [Octopus vulgaris]